MLPWKRWARIQSDRKIEWVGLWRAFKLIFKGWKCWHTQRVKGKSLQEQAKARMWDGAVHGYRLLPSAAAPGMDVDGGWPNVAIWEAGCGPLVSILCVTSHLLLQLMGILKHKLAIWAMTTELSSRDSYHLDRIAQALRVNKAKLGQHSKVKSGTICKVKAELSKSTKRTQVWKAKVIWGARNIYF